MSVPVLRGGDAADAFVPSPRASLYTVPELLGGWTVEGDSSYADTLDARAYLAAIRQGLRVPAFDDVARARALHDVSITRALAGRLVGTRPVAIMGGHDLPRDALAYRMVAECAAALTRSGFTVLTGGGPGAMEAAHLGASFATADADSWEAAFEHLLADKDAWSFALRPGDLVTDGSFDSGALSRLHRWQKPAFEVAAMASPGAPVSIGIPTWLYGHEPPTPLAPMHAKYFQNSIREDGLLAVALYGVLYAPGKAGTLQEVFQDAAQNYYRTVGGLSPMVFLDTDGAWSRNDALVPAAPRFDVNSVLAALFVEADQRFLHYVDTVDDVLGAFASHADQVATWASSVTFG